MLTLLTFYDTTPALGLGTPTTGTIELDEGIARLLGVDRGFYIAACLAFLEFLGDKEVSFVSNTWFIGSIAEAMHSILSTELPCRFGGMRRRVNAL